MMKRCSQAPEKAKSPQQHQVLQEFPQGHSTPQLLSRELNLFSFWPSQARSLSPFPICKVRIILFIPWGSSGGLGNVYTWLSKYNPLQGEPCVCLTELLARVHTCLTPEMTVPCQEPPHYQLIMGRGRDRQVGYTGAITHV